MSKRFITFKRLRIFILLVILVIVGGATYYQTHAMSNWTQPLKVTLYPINGPDTDTIADYIRELRPEHFADIAEFLDEEADAFEVMTTPLVKLTLGPELFVLPPDPPGRQAGRLAIAKWSLDLRYWLYKNLSTFALDARHIRIFVIYHQKKGGERLKHSFGLQKGLVGVVHAFGTPAQNEQNNIVITHELLHTLGATDKYLADGQPRFPEGYGNSEKVPRHPQELAEIMAGRIAISENQFEMPASLNQCVIGNETADEIHW